MSDRDYDKAMTDAERLVRVESDVHALRSEITALASSLGSEVRNLAASVNDARRPHWDTWAAWVVVGLTVIGGGAWAIDSRFSSLESRATTNYGLIHEQRTAFAGALEKLGEVETQFRTGGQIYNQADYRHDMLIDQLWQRQFGAKLREDAPWPILGKER